MESCSAGMWDRPRIVPCVFPGFGFLSIFFLKYLFAFKIVREFTQAFQMRFLFGETGEGRQNSLPLHSFLSLFYAALHPISILKFLRRRIKLEIGSGKIYS